MSTRLRRPSTWRPLALSMGLLAFQAYLGYNAIGGQFGIESQKAMRVDIEELKATSGALQADIDAYRHKVELFNPEKLDPDILSERARALLNMAQADEVLVMLDPETGEPRTGLSQALAGVQLSDKIEGGID